MICEFEATSAASRSRAGVVCEPPDAEPPRLLDEFRRRIRLRHTSRRTEKAYLGWIRRFLVFHDGRHPRDLGKAGIEAFLSDLAVRRTVSSSTQNQALSALHFLYRDVYEWEFPWLDNLVRARRPARLPVVLTRSEVRRVLAELEGVPRLMAEMLYGAGLRLMECARLRIKDIDFAAGEVLTRDGKGRKDRRTVLPQALRAPLAAHIARVRRQHDRDLEAGRGAVALPEALARKLRGAPKDCRWQWVFPATRHHVDPKTGERRRHHLHESALQMQKPVKEAARRAGLTKRVTSQSLRHSFATHRLEAGYDIRTIQDRLGHKDVSTTMIYTHVLNKGGRGVRSPLADEPWPTARLRKRRTPPPGYADRLAGYPGKPGERRWVEEQEEQQVTIRRQAGGGPDQIPGPPRRISR